MFKRMIMGPEDYSVVMRQEKAEKSRRQTVRQNNQSSRGQTAYASNKTSSNKQFKKMSTSAASGRGAAITIYAHQRPSDDIENRLSLNESKEASIAGLKGKDGRLQVPVTDLSR